MATSDEVQPILDYTARDFDSIRSLLVGLARGLFPEWKTVGESNDFGTLLLELYAYNGDITNYYIDRVASEAFLGTAQRRQSVLYIAEMLGYRPIGQHAATVILTVSLSENYPSGELKIPAGTKVFSSSDSATTTVTFETDYDITLSAGQTAQVTATEGTSVLYTEGASTGSPNLSFTLQNSGVIARTVKVRTKEGTYELNNIEEDSPHWVGWSEVQSVAGARPSQSVFSTYVDDKSYTHILFGDSAAGRIPPVGATIEISYRYGTGSYANSIGANSLINMDGTALPVSYLTVTNADSPIGGSDPETSQSMRYSIPKGAQIKERAVTVDDYVSLAQQVPGVAKSVAYGQIYSAVNLRIAPVGGGLDDEDLMSVLRGQVQTYLSDKVLIGSKVYVENAEWTNIWIEIDLFVKEGFDRAETKKGVQTAIRNLMAYDRMDMGGNVHIGNIFRRAMAVEGVDYIDLIGLNDVSLGSSVIKNIEVPFGNIARIALPTDETDEELAESTSGLIINASGGIEST